MEGFTVTWRVLAITHDVTGWSLLEEEIGINPSKSFPFL